VFVFRSLKFFDSKGRFKRIKKLTIWKIKDVLIEKYDFQSEPAERFSTFLAQVMMMMMMMVVVVVVVVVVMFVVVVCCGCGCYATHHCRDGSSDYCAHCFL